LPREAGEAEPEAEELAAHLAFRLERLEGMRRAVDGLMRLPVTGGMRVHKLKKPRVMSLDDARNRLRRALNAVGVDISDWVSLDDMLPDGAEIGADGVPQASVKASSLLAGLELAKEGRIELRQLTAFAPIFLRGKSSEVDAVQRTSEQSEIAETDG